MNQADIKGRICLLTTAHSPFDVRVFYKQARTLAQAGYDVVLFAPHSSRTERVDGVCVRSIGLRKGRLYRMTVLLWRVVWLALTQKYYVYHFHDPELIPVGLAFKLLTSARVIYDIHEDYPRQILSKAWIPPVFRKPIAWGMELIERLAARFFDGLVAATPGIARRFPSSKTIVVNNFPRVEELTINQEETIPYPERPNWVVYVGGITTIRAAREMVKAVDFMQMPAELILAGSFESEALQNALSSLPGWSNVRLLGWLSRPEVAATLAKAKVGLVLYHPLPNHIEAQPNKIFEYMAAGIPFVASDFPHWRELGEGAGLFVNPLDPQAIAQAIDWLLMHPEEAEAMGRRGRELVLKKYNWEAEAQKLLMLYERLLS